MTLTVRLSPRVEQELAEYCVKRRLTKSEAVKLALEELLRLPEARKADLSHPYIGSDIRQGDIARHVKRLLREHFRGKKGSKRRAIGAK